MIAGSLAALALAAVAAAWVLSPLLSRRAAEAERRSLTLDRARELQSRREQLVASLKDLEDDRATDKIDVDDYAALRSQLEAEAIAILRELDTVEATHTREVEAERRAHQPLTYPGGKGAGRPR